MDFVRRGSEKTEIGAVRFTVWLETTASKFYHWRERYGKVNGHNAGFPGSILVTFASGGVWHPDGSQLQRAGVRPDVFVAPTIRGIRKARDEILERAVDVISSETDLRLVR